ncbi:MAG TPA: tetratricopeptide repeat protein [Vicinamibacteria bacterium]|nr:tetratricopeptide repeat protein [Vicinamibacteria bacterium]
MAAKNEGFRVCPKCGARNKGKWEFCVRCGEALHDVTMAPGEKATRVVALAPATEASPAGVILLSLVLLAAVAGGIWWVSGSKPPAQPDPGIFAIAQTPSRPSPSPTVVPAGQKEADGGRRALGQGDARGALKLLQQAVDSAPDNASFQSSYAQALFLAGDLPAAIQHFSTATQLEPQNVTYRMGLAAALNHAGRNDEAAQEYNRILTQEPANVDAEEDLGQLLLLRKGDAAAALPHLRKASELRPGEPIFDQQLAFALEKTQDLDGASAVYRKVLQKTPDAAEVRGRLAEILFNQGKADDAIALARAGIQRDPNVPVLHRDLGALLERAGRLPEASAAYREYARLAPNAQDARAMTERADLLAKQASGGPS